MSRALIEGSIAGILFGIYIKTGVSVDEGDTIITVITGVFEGLEKIRVVTHNWRAWLFLFSIMFTLGSFSDVLTILREEGDMETGILLYGIGFVFGLFLMLIA
ncbi:hypothetical protein FXV91_00850 [Methanosarcina sp. DH2]|uniref:hypothetical protein n=1 Tax=Methanosarcina sp. DH2 TaxID=2605639 RepID=UPI001E2C0BD7|nr:hypothetical protein [Methanosarcina sp. DH2]MCC4768795.1 hypothetical protein [Methanosarcina sp. DH2]